MKAAILFCFLGYLVCIGSEVSAQRVSSQVPPTAPLSVRGTYPIAAPSFSFSGAQCDSQGNVYFDVTGSTYSKQIILRVSSDGSDVTPIELPGTLGANGEWHYYVASNGDLFVLFSEEHKHVLLHYTPSGGNMAQTSLQLPGFFHVDSFAVMSNGRSMFTGSIEQADNSGLPFIFFLDSSGKPIKSNQQGNKFRYLDRRGDQIMVGPQDVFIEASNSRLQFYDGNGILQRTERIVKPSADSVESGAQLSDKRIAVRFERPMIQNETTFPVESIWLLLDSSSYGDPKFFRMPSSLAAAPGLCYIGQEKFRYYIVQNGKPALVDVSP
ncbi:hypothetical protein [Edaphobacter modestus]|uniref:Uncharacterized protein n=1 Tax=Edaphobacter modestus TaxID=388466 RepID=A0A4Q7XY49_9BACT|nr:hypothetical protein [Edaphobacter modestus]RZU29028.1 hypothetical protein BDD14_6622 [Edaphobacter modestus]